MKKLIVILLFAIIFMAENSYSQTSWSSEKWYAYKGNVWTECGNPYPKYSRPDQWGRQFFLGYYKQCKTTVWHQEWREGYIYYWNAQQRYWYKRYEKGTFWYYTWNIYEVRVS